VCGIAGRGLGVRDCCRTRGCMRASGSGVAPVNRILMNILVVEIEIEITITY
jgi:hypothetical protein